MQSLRRQEVCNIIIVQSDGGNHLPMMKETITTYATRESHDPFTYIIALDHGVAYL